MLSVYIFFIIERNFFKRKMPLLGRNIFTTGGWETHAQNGRLLVKTGGLEHMLNKCGRRSFPQKIITSEVK